MFERDAYRCVYCGGVFPAEALTVDHVHARVRGGDRSAGNLVTACTPCNVRKGHRRLGEFLAAEPAARRHFLEWAIHVWPRHLREVEELIERATRRGREK